MTKEELIALGLSEEQATAVFALHGKGITSLQEQVNTLTATNTALQAASDELERIKGENMTAEEKVQKALEDAENEKAKAVKMQNEIKARETLINGGIEPTEIDENLLSILVTNDETSTVARCDSYTSRIKAKLEAQEAKLKEELLKNVDDPTKPNGESVDSKKSDQEKIAIKLAEQATTQNSGFAEYLKGE